MPFDGLETDFLTKDDVEAARILREARQGIVPERGALDASKMTPRQRLLFLRDYLRTPVVSRCWNFAQFADTNPECGTPGCAAGHWRHLTRQYVLADPHLLGLSDDETDLLFCIQLDRAFGYGNRHVSQVTPTDVADAIDRLIARRPT